jgi:DNA-binding response OmpR family regulator
MAFHTPPAEALIGERSQVTEGTSQERILIVDDDAALRETIADFLSGEGYLTLEAGNVIEARAALEKLAPDLILLDINMPGGDGLTLASQLRAQISTPIIILSGKGSMVDRVVGLEVGADDYLPKPFELRELLARVRAVLRRSRPLKADSPVMPERQASFSAFVLMPSRRELTTGNGERIELTGAEYNLLAAFVERPNRVLTRDAIADLTRKDDWDAFDRSIDTLVSRLRRKLAPHADAAQLIQTVRGEGYVLACEVRWSGS